MSVEELLNYNFVNLFVDFNGTRIEVGGERKGVEETPNNYRIQIGDAELTISKELIRNADPQMNEEYSEFIINDDKGNSIVFSGTIKHE